MISVSEAVRINLSKKPHLEDLVADGLVNIMSLARLLRQDVENECMKQVSVETVAMAIRRLPKKAESISTKQIFSETPDILVRSHLCEFTVKKEGSGSSIEKIVKALSLSKEHFFTVTQGVFEDTIIVSDVYQSLVRNVLQLQHILAFFDKLAAITVRLPPENVDLPGVYYHILKSIAQDSINVMEIVSTYRECTIIVREKDVDSAFKCIKTMFG